ncbi:MAG TPA: HAMP domain-containing sensor histidine kinase [Candidatus Limnocylindrales bacterium]|nr:HAMP domain-containing sensor histidine kinase [Candidatus Limnocylindrales bacterium]
MTGPTPPREPISREDWRAYRREMWRRQRRGEWHGGPPVFGCLFALIVLVVFGSLVAASGVALSSYGPLPVVVTALVLVAVFIAIGRVFRRSAQKLDELVDAVARVEGGDYAIRLSVPERGMRPVRQLVRGFNTMTERLERDEDQRRTLLNDVSHELRTPLSVIAGNVEAMIDGVHPADEAHLSAILEETRVMERLIDDLRTVALAEAGTLMLHKEPTDLDLLVEEVVRSFQGSAGSAGVSVTADVPADLPIVDVDPVRIREVLANLVANGVRHTPSDGTVTVRGEVDGDRIVLRVVDTGPGIDPDLLPHVFERFAKGADSTGSGLGLAIARNLVVAHGGELVVEATGSAGSTFRVSLPR